MVTPKWIHFPFFIQTHGSKKWGEEGQDNPIWSTVEFFLQSLCQTPPKQSPSTMENDRRRRQPPLDAARKHQNIAPVWHDTKHPKASLTIYLALDLNIAPNRDSRAPLTSPHRPTSLSGEEEGTVSAWSQFAELYGKLIEAFFRCVKHSYSGWIWGNDERTCMFLDCSTISSQAPLKALKKEEKRNFKPPI